MISERMLTASQYAALHYLSTARIRLLCSQGRISGARKLGHFWLVPPDAKILPGKKGRGKAKGVSK